MPRQESIIEKLLTTTQAAAALTLKRTTLEAWRVRGGGPRYVKLGRAIRYRAEDIEDFIESNMMGMTTDRSSNS